MLRRILKMTLSAGDETSARFSLWCMDVIWGGVRVGESREVAKGWGESGEVEKGC